MRVFRKKEEITKSFEESRQEVLNKSEEKGIKILGAGCSKCLALENVVQEAVAQLGLQIQISHIQDFAEIASYGVMSTPALVIDHKVVSCGRVLSKEEVISLIQKEGYKK